MPITLLDSFNSSGSGSTASVTTSSASFQFQVAYILTDIFPLTITVPTGWSNLVAVGDGSGANKIGALLAYNATATIPSGGTINFTLSASGNYTITLARFLDLSTFNAGSGQWYSSATSLVTPSVASSGNSSGLAIMGIGQKSASTATFTNPAITGTVSYSPPAGSTATVTYTPSLITNVATGSNQSTWLNNRLYYAFVNAATGAPSGSVISSLTYAGSVTSSLSQQSGNFLALFEYRPPKIQLPSIF